MMTASEDDLPTNSTGLASGLRIRGLVVLAGSIAPPESTEIAIWHVGAEGLFTGAWSFAINDIQADPSVARRVLALAERRALAAWDTDATSGLLKQVGASAGVDVGDAWSSTSCPLPTALAETATARSQYELALERHRGSGRKLAALNWGTALVDPLPRSRDVLQNAARVEAGDGSVTSAALTEARLVRWCIERWADTETVRSRRPYLIEEFGTAAALPPTWLANVQLAYKSILPL